MRGQLCVTVKARDVAAVVLGLRCRDALLELFHRCWCTYMLSCMFMDNAVTTNLCWGRGCFLLCLSLSLLFLPLLPLFFPLPQSGPSNPAKGFVVALSPISGRERHLQPLDTFPGLQILLKCVCSWALAASAFFMYLEPRERIWWWKMSYFC